MDPAKRKQLVLSLCASPRVAPTGVYATQREIDSWSNTLKDAGETDPQQICAAVSFIVKTHGLLCETTSDMRCVGVKDITIYPRVPDGDSE